MIEPAPPFVRSEFALLEDLFSEVSAGRLRIPQFSPTFAWKPADMLALFDSIQKGYPIGNLLLWDANEPVPSADHIGPLKIPEPSIGQVTYILDGQQRLSTLYGVLCLAADSPRDADRERWRWWIYYDLKRRAFLHIESSAALPHLMPLRALLRTMDFLQEARRMKEALLEKEASALLEQAEKLAQRVKSYKVAVTRIEGGSLEQAVDILARLSTPRGTG